MKTKGGIGITEESDNNIVKVGEYKAVAIHANNMRYKLDIISRAETKRTELLLVGIDEKDVLITDDGDDLFVSDCGYFDAVGAVGEEQKVIIRVPQGSSVGIMNLLGDINIGDTKGYINIARLKSIAKIGHVSEADINVSEGGEVIIGAVEKRLEVYVPKVFTSGTTVNSFSGNCPAFRMNNVGPDIVFRASGGCTNVRFKREALKID